MVNLLKALRILALASILLSPVAQAGVMNIPTYIPSGAFGLGIEPELILSDGAGIGINGRFQYGLSDLSNIHFLVGNGQGPKLFRTSATITFDFFPDIEGQPGIGLALKAGYVNLATGGRFDTVALPYIQKTINGKGGTFTPYLAIPLGIGFTAQGTYAALSSAVIGSAFKISDQFRYYLEVGIGMWNTETYFSTGLMIYP